MGENGFPKKEISFKACFESYYSIDARNPSSFEGKKFALRALVIHIYASIISIFDFDLRVFMKI